MTDMTLKDAQALRSAVEQRMSMMLREFEQTTGLRVTGVELATTVEMLGNGGVQLVQLEVAVPR